MALLVRSYPCRANNKIAPSIVGLFCCSCNKLKTSEWIFIFVLNDIHKMTHMQLDVHLDRVRNASTKKFRENYDHFRSDTLMQSVPC
jgi:hypothetical protein